MEFCVYVWRDAKCVPFYVGKGTEKRSRNTTQRSSEFKEIYAAGGCAVEIVDWFIHESQALAHEIVLIARYGRREFGGLLVNKTEGGEGTSGLTRTAESRAKISKANTGKTPSAATRLKIGLASKGRKLSPEHIARLVASNLGRTPSVETVAKMRGAWADPEIREKRCSGISAAINDPEYLKVLSARTAAQWKDADIYERRSSGIRSALSGPEARAKRSDEVRKSWSDPRSRERRTAATRMSPSASGGHKGVHFYKARSKWTAKINVAGKAVHLGYFSSSELAARAYDMAAYAAWGDACYLNFPDEIRGSIAA